MILYRICWYKSILNQTMTNKINQQRWPIKISIKEYLQVLQQQNHPRKTRSSRYWIRRQKTSHYWTLRKNKKISHWSKRKILVLTQTTTLFPNQVWQLNLRSWTCAHQKQISRLILSKDDRIVHQGNSEYPQVECPTILKK